MTANQLDNFFISPKNKKFTLVYYKGNYDLWFEDKIEDKIIKTIENVKEPTTQLSNRLLIPFSQYMHTKNKFPKVVNEVYESIVDNIDGDNGFDILKNLFQGLVNKKIQNRNLNDASDKIKNNYNKSNIKDKSLKGIIEAIVELLNDNYENSLNKIENGKTKTLYVDCDILKKYKIHYDDSDVEESLYYQLKTKPTEFIEMFNLVLDGHLPENIKEYYVKFDNYNEEVKLKNLLSDKLGTFIKTTGTIKGVYEIKSMIKRAVFECRGCGRQYEVDSIGGKIAEQTLCEECGGRSFRLLEDDSVHHNSRKLLIEEPIEDMGNKTNPRNMMAVAVGDNDFINKMNVGDRVNITGRLTNFKEDHGEEYKFYIDCNNIEIIGDVAIEISEDEEKQIIELSKEENIFEKLVNSSAVDLKLPKEMIQAMLCCIVGGGVVRGRSEIHSLIIGNPGEGKSDLLEWVDSVSEKCILTSGTSSSAVGMTGAVDKDPITNQNVLKAGALVLASGGICAADELDKLNKTGFNALNNMIEKGKERFDKGGIHETLYCKCSFIGAANPKYGSFDKFKSLKDQIIFPSTFLSRMDTIFIYQKDPDEGIVDLILDRFTGEEIEVKEQEISGELLKKYLYYAKHNFKPILTKEAKQKASEYVKSVLKFNETTDLNEVVEFTLSRFTNSIGRLGGAIAKLHLRDKILVEDIEKVIDLKNYCFKLMGFDIENESVNEEIVNGELNSSKRIQYQRIYEIILEEKENEESVYLSEYGVSKQYIKSRFVELTRLSERTCDNVLNELYKDNKLTKNKDKGKRMYYDIVNVDEWSDSIL